MSIFETSTCFHIHACIYVCNTSVYTCEYVCVRSIGNNNDAYLSADAGRAMGLKLAADWGRRGMDAAREPSRHFLCWLRSQQHGFSGGPVSYSWREPRERELNMAKHFGRV
jgi:hypothetical protein